MQNEFSAQVSSYSLKGALGMNSQGFWRRRETRIAIYAILFLCCLILIFASESLGRAIVSFGKSSWPTEDVYRTAAMVRQAGILTGGISGLGLVLESSKLGEKNQDSTV